MFKKFVAFILAISIVMGFGLSSVSASSAGKFGDADENGKLDAKDALQILQYSVGKRQFTTSIKIYSDVDGDGLINAVDALYVLKKAVGKIDAFPVENKKRLTVAVEQNFYPYSWESNGVFYGLHVDIAKELAKRNGFAVDFVSVTWDDFFVGIQNGTYNLVFGVTPTEERKELFLGTPVVFSDVYYDDMAAMINIDEFDLTYSEGKVFVDGIANMINDGTIESLLSKYDLSIKPHNAYEYLKNWVKANGVNDGDEITFIIEEQGSMKYGLSYSTEYDNIYIWRFDSFGQDIYSYSSIFLDDYFYGLSFYGDRIYGYIDAPYYTVDSKLTYADFECSIYTAEQMLSLAETSVDLLIEVLRNCLLVNDMPITIADLGFQSY